MARWRGYKTWFMGQVLKVTTVTPVTQASIDCIMLAMLKDSARLQVYKEKDDEQILVDVKYHDDNIEVAEKLGMHASLRRRATPSSPVC